MASRVQTQGGRKPPADTERVAEIKREPNPLKRALKVLGPGLITGASDDDPSGIGTYSVAGASFGFATLWMALVTFPLMTATQITCARIAQVRGRGLAAEIRQHFPRWVLYPVLLALIVANTLNAGADIGAIAAAINLLLPVPVLALIVPVGVALVLVQMWCPYRLIADIFKWLTLALLAYVAAAIFVRPDALAVLKGTFVPTLRTDPRFIAILVAILGTTISPYLWFWQASQEVEEEKSSGRTTVAQRRGASKAEKQISALDTGAGMLASQIVMYFIILTTGATLYASGQRDINSATDAAAALRPLAGDGATILLALGLIGAGLLAVPVLTGSAAYAVAESFGWREGLDRKPLQARAFYAVIALSTIAGMLLNFIGINPIDALFWTAVVNGVLAPPLLAVIMLLAGSRTLLGSGRPGPVTLALGWTTVGLMSAAALALIVTL